MKLYNQGAIFFTRVDSMSGNETLNGFNHCYLLMRYEDGVAYYNSGERGCVSRFKIPNILFTDSKNGFSKATNFCGASGPYTISPENQTMPSSNLNKLNTKTINVNALKFYQHINPFKNFFQPEIAPEHKFRHSNCPDDFQQEAWYYYLCQKFLLQKPKLILDVGVFADSANEFFYGRPMYCHNFIVNLLGLQIGNVLTTEHFKNRLLDWNGKTNFVVNTLYEENNDLNNDSSS